MDYFYDNQIRRYVTQFMRVFIGFKYKVGDSELKEVPVMYGDMTRQVASIIKENSENKLSTVPKVACYISGLELATDRLSDPTFVSKVHIRERRFTDAGGTRDYQNVQGGNYTVERLMPTPYKLSMKADMWTSNNDQKLQLLEQILVLFNPSLELQTTDNYLDWTSLSVLNLTNITFSSRSIPAGNESEIDICTLEFDMPIWISPPTKVKKLGIVQTIINNVFTDNGDFVNLDNLIYNGAPGSIRTSTNRYRVLLFKSNTGNLSDNIFDLTLVDPNGAVLALGLDRKSFKNGEPLDWNAVLETQGGYVPGSDIWFQKPNGGEILGTFIINPIDPSILTVSLDRDTYPGNTSFDNNGRIQGLDNTRTIYTEPGFDSSTARDYVDAIIDPYKFNLLEVYGSYSAVPVGIRYLMLEDVNNSVNREGFNRLIDGDDSARDPYDGPDGWKYTSGEDPYIKANSIILWNGTEWITIFDPAVEYPIFIYFQNMRTGIKYRWDGIQWLKAFEGEYGPGEWNFKLV